MEKVAEKKERSITTVYDVTKNPMFCLQEAIRAILRCLGLKSSKPEKSSSSSESSPSLSDKKEESEKQDNSCVFQEDGTEVNKQQGADSASTNNNKDDPPTEADDPPESQTLWKINKMVRWIKKQMRNVVSCTMIDGRPPPRPPVMPGPPPENN